MDRVYLGLNVDIKRTDRKIHFTDSSVIRDTILLTSILSGRVHPAKISCINALSRTVTVEWLENGETKAKEVEANF